VDQKIKPVQLDLFNKLNVDDTQKVNFKARFSSRINLSVENIIVLAIFAGLSILLFFSLGVERGKRQAINNNPASKSIIQETVVIPEKATAGATEKILVRAPAKLTGKTSGADLFIKTTPPVNSGQVKVVGITSETDRNNLNVTRYTIQVATFQKEDFARQEIARLKGMGYQVIMKKSGQLNSLSVGSFSDKKEAETVLRKLRSKYDDCYIRRL